MRRETRVQRAWLAVLAITAVPIIQGGAHAKGLDGTVTALKGGEVVVFRHSRGSYDVRIFGIDAPDTGQRFAAESRKHLTRLVVGKPARIRFKFRNPQGQMVSRLWVGETEIGPEMLRAGLAWREPGKDEKYGELAAAEAQGRQARRGLWVEPNPTPPWEFRRRRPIP